MAYGIFGKPFGQSLADTAKPYTDRLSAMVPEYAPQHQPMQQPKPNGTKRAIGILGDFLLGLGGQQGVYGPMAMQQRLIDRRSQEQAQQAEAERAGRREQFMFEHDYKRNNPLPSDAQPYRFEDNAGNVWERQPDGTNKRIFTDRALRQTIVNGQVVNTPNPYLNEGMAELPPGFQVQGGPASAPGGFPR